MAHCSTETIRLSTKDPAVCYIGGQVVVEDAVGIIIIQSLKSAYLNVGISSELVVWVGFRILIVIDLEVVGSLPNHLVCF